MSYVLSITKLIVGLQVLTESQLVENMKKKNQRQSSTLIKPLFYKP